MELDWNLTLWLSTHETSMAAHGLKGILLPEHNLIVTQQKML
jgi:hypothetical protein